MKIGQWRQENGNRNMEIGKQKQENGNRKQEIGKRKQENGNMSGQGSALQQFVGPGAFGP